MPAKFKNTKMVYSTNPDFNQWDEQGEEAVTLSPKDQKLIVSLDKKQRKGKKVTLVAGFVGNNNDLKELGKVLKSKCGVGGSVKDEQIIVQGNFKEKVAGILIDMGYRCKTVG